MPKHPGTVLTNLVPQCPALILLPYVSGSALSSTDAIKSVVIAALACDSD